MNNGEPESAQCFYKGQYCKVGKNNKVFVYRDGEWVFTNGITVSQVENEIHRRKFEGIIKPLRRGIDFDNP